MAETPLRELLEVMCHCGRPGEMVGVVHGLLAELRDWFDRPDPQRQPDQIMRGIMPPGDPTYRAEVEAHLARLDAIVPNKAAWLYWYVFDHWGWTEHGGSVPGWLTDEGREVVAYLDEQKGEPHPDGEPTYGFLR